jgi:hypothetical protein
VAARPEAPRLFDLEPCGPTSDPGIVTGPSRSGTQGSLSGSDTPAPPASRDETATANDPLQAVRDAAKMEAAARDRLDQAIAIARAAGHSWRALGIASGTPYQTLHRNHKGADGRRRVVEEGP